MFDQERINSQNLFQRTSFYLNLKPNEVPRTELDHLLSLQKATTTLLCRADTTLYHLEQVYDIRARLLDILARCAPGLDVKSHPIMVFGPQVNELVSELAATFVNLRLMMDATWWLLRIKEKLLNAPRSFRSAIKSIESGQQKDWILNLQTDAKNALLDYWTRSGKNMASYRDIDQHYDILARQCIAYFQDSVPIKLGVLLPDDPEEKSPKNFSFANDIQGIELAEQSFEELHRLIEAQAPPKEAKPMSISGWFAQANPPIEASKYPGATLGISLMNRRGSHSVEFHQSQEGTVLLTFRTGRYPREGDLDRTQVAETTSPEYQISLEKLP